MRYDFNEIVDRQEHFSAKVSEMNKWYGTNELLPMWIADMDFRVPLEIKEELLKRVEHGIFGYTTRPDSYNEAIVNWLFKRHNFKIESEDIIFSPGVIPAVSMALNVLTEKDDKIMILEPLYSPLHSVIDNNNREAIVVPLKRGETGSYEMDFENIKENIKGVKMFFLCNPHNPVGRVWTKEELLKLHEILKENNVIVVSDEIHSDIIFKGHTHIPFASLSAWSMNNTITCMAPSKTFNIAGLQCSYILVRNNEIREKIINEFTRIDIKRNTPFSLVATETAYTKCEAWLDELLVYLEDNADYVIKYIKENLDGVTCVKQEGTYLMWLDFNGTKKSSKEISKLLIEKGKVALNDGNSFGLLGDGFKRLNIACPREVLKEALDRIKKSIS